MGDMDDGMRAQEIKWGWSLPEELKRQRLEREEHDSVHFPHGRTFDGEPAIPDVELLGSYVHARPMGLGYAEQQDDCRDPSLPHERQGWFFCGEGNFTY